MMRILLLISGFFVGWICPAKCLAQGSIESAYTARHFVPADGLPQIQVTSLMTDTKGFVWVGTKFGLARWDGARFRTFMPEDAGDGRQVQHLRQGPGNRILVTWIAPTFSIVEGNHIETVHFPAHWKARHALGIYPRDSVSVFVAVNAFTDEKHYRKSLVAVFDLRLRRFVRETWLPQWWIGGVFPEGQVVTADWIPETGEFPRIYLYQYARLQRVMQPPFALNEVHLDNQACVGFFRKGDSTAFYEVEPGNGDLRLRRVPVTMRDGLPESSKQYLLRVSDSLSYYTVPGLGLVQRNGQSERLISTLPISNRKLLDHEGNLWVASENGLYCFYRQAIREYRFNLSERFPDAVLSMAKDTRGQYFFSSYDHGFWQAGPSLSSWQRLPWLTPHRLRETMRRGSYAIRTLRNEGLLLTTSSGFIYRHGSHEQIVDLYGKGAEVFATWEDTLANRVLISKHSFLFSFDLNRLQVDTLLKLPHQGLRSLLDIAVGEDNLPVLVGSGNPLKWDGQSWRPIPGKTDMRAISACIDNRNGLWAGGVQPPTLFRGDSAVTLKQFPGKQLVLSMTTWRKWLVIGGGYELVFLDLERFYETGEEVYQVFDAGSGLTITEGGQNGFFRDTDGSFWWPCQDKLLRFWPEQLITEAANPPVPLVLEMTVRDPGAPGGDFAIAPGTILAEVPGTHRAARFLFGAAAMSSPQNLRYRYRLNGYSKAWSEPVAEGSAAFTRLPPGRYQLEVQSSRDLVHWSQSVFSPAMVVPAFTWETSWFRMLAAMLAIALVVLLTLRVSVHKRKRAERQRQFNEMQLQSIRSKSLPHFTGNVFSNIDYFIEKGDRENASRYLAVMSRLYAVTLRDSDRASRSLREELDYVNLYIDMEKMRFGDRLHFETTIEPGVNLDTQVPNMVLHTFVENAVKHGISPRREGGRVQIFLVRTGDGVEIRVEDDGVGRAASASSAREHSKQGLLILERQVALYNRNNHRKIQLRVEDLIDPDGSPTGTRYRVAVPENYRYI